MTFQQLIYFTSVVKYNSITVAAKSLFITQPAISIAIKSLENELQTKLFDRYNNQLRLTPSGKYLYDESMKILDDYNNLNAKMQKFINDNKEIKLGIPPMIGTFLFPKIFEQYNKQHNDVKLITTEIGTLSLIKQLKDRSINLAIGSMGELIEDKQINYYTLFETEIIYSVYPKHHFANKPFITLDMLKDEPIILLKEDSYQYLLINKYFNELNIEPNIIMTSNQIYTIKQLLSYNKAGAFMFKEIVDNDNDLIGIPLKDPIKIKIALLTNKDNEDDETIKSFIKFIKSFNNHYN